MKTVRTIFLFVLTAFLVVSFTSYNTGRQDNKDALFLSWGESSSFVESDKASIGFPMYPMMPGLRTYYISSFDKNGKKNWEIKPGLRRTGISAERRKILLRLGRRCF